MKPQQTDLINQSESEPLIDEAENSPPVVLPRHMKRHFPKYNNSNSFRVKRHRILIAATIIVTLLFVHLVIFSNVKVYNKKEVEGWSKNTSRDIAEYILPNENTTLIESAVCQRQDDALLLIVVCSSAENYEARQTIRETWGNISQFNYPLFDKFHGSQNASYLNINDRNWRNYVEV